MKLILTVTLLATLPLAAQMSDPTQGSDSTSGSSDSTPTNAPPAAAPIEPPAGQFNPSENEPVVQAPPVDTNAPPAASPDDVRVIQAPAAGTMPAQADGTAVPPPALAPDPFNDPLIVQIVGRYQRAWDGDRKETKSLTADLERWTKDEPNNYLLLAYLGSAYSLDSRDSWIGPGKISYLKKGDLALDDAVKGDPLNPAVRLLRAMNYYELPAIFRKHEAAHEDFAYLLEQIHGALPMPYKLDTNTLQAIYYYAGLSDAQFSQKKEAMQLWQTGLALAPTSPLGLKIQTEMNKPQG
jgi:hypothetical protein